MDSFFIIREFDFFYINFPIKRLPHRYRTGKGAKPMISKIITDSFQ